MCEVWLAFEESVRKHGAQRESWHVAQRAAPCLWPRVSLSLVVTCKFYMYELYSVGKKLVNIINSNK